MPGLERAATTFLLRVSLAKHHEEDDEPGVQVEAKAGEEVGDEPGVQMEANAGGEIAEEGTAAVNVDWVVEAPSGYEAQRDVSSERREQWRTSGVQNLLLVRHETLRGRARRDDYFCPALITSSVRCTC